MASRTGQGGPGPGVNGNGGGGGGGGAMAWRRSVGTHGWLPEEARYDRWSARGANRSGSIGGLGRERSSAALLWSDPFPRVQKIADRSAPAPASVAGNNREGGGRGDVLLRPSNGAHQELRGRSPLREGSIPRVPVHNDQHRQVHARPDARLANIDARFEGRRDSRKWSEEKRNAQYRFQFPAHRYGGEAVEQVHGSRSSRKNAQTAPPNLASTNVKRGHAASRIKEDARSNKSALPTRGEAAHVDKAIQVPRMHVVSRGSGVANFHRPARVNKNNYYIGGARGPEEGSSNTRTSSGNDADGVRYHKSIYNSVSVEMVSGEGEILPTIVGTCPHMCPARERGRRERLRDLAIFERAGGQLGRTSPDLAVKKFCRTLSSADSGPSDLRPLPVLRVTVDYLWSLLDQQHSPFKLVHDFLFDRTRAVRQDMSMQQIVNNQAIVILEEIVRFHILSERELHEQSLTDKYLNSDLNQQQLSKALISLLNMYSASDEHGQLPCEPEFLAYFVLLNLATVGQGLAEPLAPWFSTLHPPLFHSPEMVFARKVLRSFRTGNFRLFFRLAAEATYLQACLMELVFNRVRAHALAVLNQSSYKLHPYPLPDLAKLLLMEEDNIRSLCTFYGLSVGVDNSTGGQCLLVKQAPFVAPEKAAPWFNCHLIQGKRPPSHIDTVLGRSRNT